MRSWWPPAYSGTFVRCLGHGSASSIWMVTSMWWLMILRSSSVSVPARIVRFSTSSSVRKSAVVARRRRASGSCADICCTRSLVLGVMRSPPMLQQRRNSRSSSICAQLRAQRASISRPALVVAVLAALELRAAACAISASRLSTSKRVSIRLDAVEDGLQLGRLVDHVHRRGDLAAVVQQARRSSARSGPSRSS